MQSNKNHFDQIEQAILKTLIYSDIFDFPLTKEELWTYVISNKKIEKSQFEKALTGLINFETFEIYNVKKQVAHKDGFFCLAGREDIILKRKGNKSEVQKKFDIAKKAAYYLSFIPSIQYIGVSGGLSIGNAGKDDDVDFFIITKKNTLFMTRFWILALLEMLNLRRKPGEKDSPDKICVNLLVDQTKLSWSAGKRDLYTAHEIIQTLPLFERDGMYDKFLESNNWVKKYFPNFKKRQHNRHSGLSRISNVASGKRSWMPPRFALSYQDDKYKIGETNYLVLQFLSFFIFFLPFEIVMRNFQKYYMKKHKSTEIIATNLIAFHPNNYGVKTMEILSSKCRNLGLLTNF